MKKKIIAIALCAALAVGGVVAGSLAWLQDTSDPVVNTFTVGDITIDLDESDSDVLSSGEGDSKNNSYKMIPGNTIAKDPFATVMDGSEPCYLFVKVTESANFNSFMTWKEASGWSVLSTSATETVLWRLVDESDTTTKWTDAVLDGNVTYKILDGDKVTVKTEGVTQELMDTLSSDNYPTLTFTAYAVQKANIADANTAWTNLQAELSTN